jgi:hypothetical protein
MAAIGEYPSPPDFDCMWVELIAPNGHDQPDVRESNLGHLLVFHGNLAPYMRLQNTRLLWLSNWMEAQSTVDSFLLGRFRQQST